MKASSPLRVRRGNPLARLLVDSATTNAGAAAPSELMRRARTSADFTKSDFEVGVVGSPGERACFVQQAPAEAE